MSKTNESKIILVDFDGTCVKHDFPRIGDDVPGAVETLRALVREGHKIILWTVRSDLAEVEKTPNGIHSKGGNYLSQAEKWFSDREIPLYGVNELPGQKSWSTSPKAHGEYCIDDRAVGCPLIRDPIDRHFVNWQSIRYHLILEGLIRPRELNQ